MSMPSSWLRVLNLGEALNLAIHSFSSVRHLMTSWGVCWRTATLKVCPSVLKWMATRVSSLFFMECWWSFIRLCSQQPVSPTYAALQAVQLFFSSNEDVRAVFASVI